MNLLLCYSPLERFALAVGIVCATILGCCVPSAIYCVGEVVTLFITNRRARLAALVDHEIQLGHVQLAAGITDYAGDTEELMDELSKDIDETAAAVASINASNSDGFFPQVHGNITVSEVLILNQHLNVEFLEKLYFLVCAFVVISCTQFITASAMTLTFNICTLRMAKRWRKMIQSEKFKNSVENKEFSTTLIIRDIEQIERGLGDKCPHLIFGCITLIASLILAFYKRWELAFVLSPIFFLALFGKKLVTKLQAKSNQQLTMAITEANMSFQDTLENLPTLVAFQGEPTEIQRYEEKLSRVITAVGHNKIIVGIANGILITIPHFLNAIMLWIGVRLVITDLNESSHLFLPGSPVVVFFCYVRGLLTFNKHWIFYDDVRKAFTSGKKLMDMMKALGIEKDGFFKTNLQFLDEKVEKVQQRGKSSLLSFGDRRLRTPSAVRRLAFPMNSSRLRFSSLDEKKMSELGNSKETMVLLVRFIYPDIIFLLIGCLGSILLGVLFPMLFYTFCEIIGAMANLDDETVYHRTTACAIVYACLGASAFLGTCLQIYMNERVAVKLGNRLRKCLFVTFLKKAQIDYEDSIISLSKLKKIISNDVPTLEKAISSAFGPGLQFLSAVVAALPIAMTVHSIQALLLYIIVPILFCVYAIYNYVNNRKTRQLLRRFHRMQNSGLALKQNIIVAAINGCFCAIREMAFGTILLYGAQLIVHHGVSNKDVLQVNLVIINPALQIGLVAASGMEFLRGWNAMKNISEFLFTNFTNENKISCSSQSDGSRISPTLEALDVVLRRGSLVFVDNSENCQGFSFSVRNGQTVKLIDKYNDKELCLRTILGLRKPARGRILINGVDIDLLSPTWLRRHVSVADDSFPFFANLTLKENLSYGNSNWKPEIVDKLLKDCKMSSTIKKFSQGLESKYCDVSTQLSIEENKKLILIRSLLRNPSILILSEDYLFSDVKEHLDENILVIVSSRSSNEL